MVRIYTFVVLFLSYLGYSALVFTKGTESPAPDVTAANMNAQAGKIIFQEYNCIACHQIYGLGGYLGPDLTTAWSDPSRGKHYIQSFLRFGGIGMPNFNLTETQIDQLLKFLEHTDASARSQHVKNGFTKK